MKAPYQVPVGHAPLGRVWGHPPQKLFEICVLEGAVWCSLGRSEASKLYFICTTLFTVIFHKMAKPTSLLTHYSSFVVMRFATKISINLIDTTVNNYIAVQEQWKILEITITMCLYCHAYCNCNCSSHVMGIACYIWIVSKSPVFS